VLVPGLAITVTALAFNLLGDGIRDPFDPCLSPAFLRFVTGSSRTRMVQAGPVQAAVLGPRKQSP